MTLDSADLDSTSYTARDVRALAQLCGRNFEVLSGSGVAKDEEQLFQGTMWTEDSSFGAAATMSHIRMLQDFEQSCDIFRGICLAFTIDVSDAPGRFGYASTMLTPNAGETTVLTMTGNGDPLCGAYRRGAAIQSAVIRFSLAEMRDPELYDLVETLSRCDDLKQIGCIPRYADIARSFFSHPPVGDLGVLFRESRMLTLLAEAGSTCFRSHAADPDMGRLFRADRLKMARVYDRLVSEPGEAYTLFTLAREAGVSISTLKNKFRAVYGTSVFSILATARMEQARAGIEKENWSIAQAANSAGYRHAANFSTAFRKRFGYSPRYG